MILQENRLGRVIAYHSCDKAVGLKILLGKDILIASDNNWDWLGNGIYFWEEDPKRALDYAIKCSKGKQFNKIRIIEPFVLGAIIDLSYCLNLTDSSSVKILKESYSVYKDLMETAGSPMVTNEGPKRLLDCAVFATMHSVNIKENRTPYETIRGAFYEGEPVYKGANFLDKTHLQICVINHNCIKGYFLPFVFEGFEEIHKSVSSILPD